MKKEILNKARFLEGDISQAEYALEAIDKILDDYDNFGSSIEFKKNSDSFSRSFGSKKYDLKEGLKALLIKLKNDTELDIIKLKKEFDEL